MPADKIVTQTNFAVQFTSRSLPHLGETPGCLIWHLPQVFICHQLSTNCILSLQIQHNGWLCLLFPGLWSVGEGLFITLGTSGHLSTTVSTPCDFHNSIRALLSHQPKGLGDREILQWHHLPPSLYWRRRQQEIECMVSLQYGWTPIRPGFPLWRKWLGNWLPWPPVDLIGLMPWCSSTRTPTMHHSLRRGT